MKEKELFSIILTILYIAWRIGAPLGGEVVLRDDPITGCRVRVARGLSGRRMGLRASGLYAATV